jgi:alpha-N-acetylglucosamine transferase
MFRYGKRLFSSLVLACTLWIIGYIIWGFCFQRAVSTSSRRHHQKYAYATFLGPPAGPSSSGLDPNTEPYFTSVRLLNYQVLHSPNTHTRLRPPIPFLVLTLPSVPASQVATLVAEGATVVPVQPLDLPPTFEQSTIKRSRFRDVLAKLRLWQLTQYDKVLALDADTLILAPLDPIFDDPDLSTPMPTLQSDSSLAGLGWPLPSTYLLSASADTWGSQAGWIKSNHPAYLCACFMLLRPSDAIFAYYEWVLNQPEARFEAYYPDQDLLIYAHRPEGAMPWRRVPVNWSMNDGEAADELEMAENSVKSLHVKGWKGADGGNVGSEKVKKLWKDRVDEMERYYLQYKNG